MSRRYVERYRKRLGEGTDGTARSVRMKHSKDSYNRNFKDIIGYLPATYTDAKIVNANGAPQDLDIVISTNTNGYERLITCRPDTLLETGTYVMYEEMGIKKIAIVRELLKSEPLPTYKAFECSQTLHIKNCPIPFPCFSYNSTYSSKGLVDTTRNYILDSRNKLYIQKNVFSCKLWENYHGYRVILGDENGTVVFKITEMDDFSYKGMFIVSLKVEQRHHLDGAENPLHAWNEEEIDFSGLGGIPISDEDPLELHSDLYGRVGDTLEVIANKPIDEWDCDNTFFEDIEILSSNTLKGTLVKSGKLTIKALTNEKERATRTIIVKERE